MRPDTIVGTESVDRTRPPLTTPLAVGDSTDMAPSNPSRTEILLSTPHRMPRGSSSLPPLCHPDRKSYCKRLCQSCYVKARQKVRTKRATCHPDRPHSAHGLCANCCVARFWRGVDPKRRSAKWRRAHLKHTFGLSVEQFDAILESQNGRCAICRDSFGERRAALDHDHNTGAVRGLLCVSCNTRLAFVERYGHEALAYLAKHGKRPA
jgi:hypothetical protein